ncbi:MAG: hypothetical protein ACLTS1_00500 [Coprococcus sp.]
MTEKKVLWQLHHFSDPGRQKGNGSIDPIQADTDWGDKILDQGE